MNTVRLIIKEFVGLFIDDGSLALFALVLIFAVAAAVKLLGLPPLTGGILLVVGCLAILAESVHRAARRR
jgi:hypothetical protein